MNTKSIAMLAVTSLLTASIAYVAPAMADDLSNSMPMEQMLADNSSGSSMQAPSDTNAPDQTSSSTSTTDTTTTTTDNNTTSNNANQGTDAASTNNSDQGSPDTATGDDDY